MRVMHIISGDLWAGAEVQAYTLLKELRAECELHVVLMNPGELADRLKALAIPVTLLDESKMNPVKILLGLRNIMLSFRPDIVHTHRQKENILGAVANLLSVRSKCVRTSHGAPEFSAKGIRQLQPKLDNFIGRYVQHGIISVSDDLTQKLQRIFPAKKIHTIPNGIDKESLISQRQETDFRINEPDKIHIGIIGRLEPVKRIDIFLRMAALLLRKPSERPMLFHVVGEGSQREILEKECKALGLNESVIFHGHRKDIPALISSLDMVVMCSDHEGTPMTALETLALGVPLIAHNVGGLKDVLDRYPEWQVDEHTAQGYANVVTVIIKNNHQEIVLNENYSSHRNALKTLGLYKSLL